MARLPLTTEPSKAYVGMLIVTAVAMLVGITALVLEGGEYDWVQKPPSIAARGRSIRRRVNPTKRRARRRCPSHSKLRKRLKMRRVSPPRCRQHCRS